MSQAIEGAKRSSTSISSLLEKLWQILKDGRFRFFAVVVLFYKFILWRYISKLKKQVSMFQSHIKSWSTHEDFTDIQACLVSTEHIGIGRIEKRTLFVKKLRDLFPNDYIRERVIQAAQRVSEAEGEEILTKFLEPEDKWHVLNACTNHLSQIFAPAHVYFNEARRGDSGYYRSSWYCFTLTCTRTSGTGRFFITPNMPVQKSSDIGTLRIRILLVSEPELRCIASGEVEPPPKGFFNQRHEERFDHLLKFGYLFLRQLESVTGVQNAPDWGHNLCGRIGATGKKRAIQDSGNEHIGNGHLNGNGSSYGTADNINSSKPAQKLMNKLLNPSSPNYTSSANNNGNNNSSFKPFDASEQYYGHSVITSNDGTRTPGADYEAEDNCFLRIHIPFPGNQNAKTHETGCKDVVLYE